MNTRFVIGGVAAAVVLGLGALELVPTTKPEPLSPIDPKPVTYTPEPKDTPSLYKPNPAKDTSIEELEKLSRSLEKLNTRLERLNRDLERTQLPPESDEQPQSMEARMVEALGYGSVEDRKRRIDEIINDYVCSLSPGLILYGRNTFESEALGIKADPHTIVVRYASYPLEPIDVLFQLMGGDEEYYPLREAFEVYVRAAYDLKPSQPGMETTVIMTCNEE
ncbi:hypothetical protein HYT55_02550 [Candidatus Woesearchaeota archaeon]|nr:hypothetical protein [Candidatus Woesearchaeota archaeon]